MSDPVLYSCRDHVGELVLNRPDNRNSMTAELLAGFERAIALAKADPDLRCLIIRGEGSCFSAGADFKAALQIGQGLPHERSYAMYRPFLSVLDIEVPVIGALNGHAVGGGFGLALVTDIRIAAENAKYGANFTRLGLHPGMGISYILPRLVGVSKAAEMLFTGQLVFGKEAAQMGLVSSACLQDQVLSAARTMAGTIAQNAPLVVRTTKRALYDGLGFDPRQAARAEAAIQAASLQTLDAKEGMAALLEKRTPVFKGA